MQFYVELNGESGKVMESHLMNYILDRHGDGGMNKKGTAKAMQLMSQIRSGKAVKIGEKMYAYAEEK